MALSICQLRSRFVSFLSFSVILLNANSCAARPTPQAVNSALEVSKLETYLKNSGKFTNILALMKRTGPSGTLPGLTNIGLFISAGSITLFLPTDAAYAKLDAPTKLKLSSGDFASLQAVLQFQVVLSRLTGTDLIGLKKASTIITKYKGQTIEKLADGSPVKLKPVGQTSLSTVIMPNAYMTSTYMAVHGVDTFLFPKM